MITMKTSTLKLTVMTRTMLLMLIKASSNFAKPVFLKYITKAMQRLFQ